MAPKRATRSTPVTPAPTTTTTTVTEAQLQALIDQGVAAAMAEAEASRVRNGYNSNGSGPRPAQAVRECSYSEFLKCKPLDFKGTEGVVGLTRWFEKMESVFSISNCTTSCQVKFVTCTLQDDALTCGMPLGEIKKIETEMWNLKDKIEKYLVLGQNYDTVGGGQCKGSKQKPCKSYPSLPTELMDEKEADQRPGPCPPRCNNCKKVGHLAKDCRSRPANANNNNRNNNNNNQKGNGLQRKVYVVGMRGQTPENILGSQIDITPSTLDHYYDVELADGRIIGLNNILSGCTLNFLNHLFNINLMPVELGGFDAIIGMDWLVKYQAVIVCAQKIVRIPWRNETLIIHGDGSNQGNVTRLNIISCTKTQKYMEKGFPIFLAHVTAKEVEDKSKKKRLEDVPIVRDFPEVFMRTCRNKQEHEEHLKLILELLKKEELYAKFSKCEFSIPKVQFLGQVIDSEGIHVDLAKIESIKY
ncbi:putative reverse transcriptase domain-containing protein [Tanacetum coccineum]